MLNAVGLFGKGTAGLLELMSLLVATCEMWVKGSLTGRTPKPRYQWGFYLRLLASRQTVKTIAYYVLLMQLPSSS